MLADEMTTFDYLRYELHSHTINGNYYKNFASFNSVMAKLNDFIFNPMEDPLKKGILLRLSNKYIDLLKKNKDKLSDVKGIPDFLWDREIDTLENITKSNVSNWILEVSSDAIIAFDKRAKVLDEAIKANRRLNQSELNTLYSIMRKDFVDDIPQPYLNYYVREVTNNNILPTQEMNMHFVEAFIENITKEWGYEYTGVVEKIVSNDINTHGSCNYGTKTIAISLPTARKLNSEDVSLFTTIFHELQHYLQNEKSSKRKLTSYNELLMEMDMCYDDYRSPGFQDKNYTILSSEFDSRIKARIKARRYLESIEAKIPNKYRIGTTKDGLSENIVGNKTKNRVFEFDEIRPIDKVFSEHFQEMYLRAKKMGDDIFAIHPNLRILYNPKTLERRSTLELLRLRESALRKNPDSTNIQLINDIVSKQSLSFDDLKHDVEEIVNSPNVHNKAPLISYMLINYLKNNIIDDINRRLLDTKETIKIFKSLIKKDKKSDKNKENIKNPTFEEMAYELKKLYELCEELDIDGKLLSSKLDDLLEKGYGLEEATKKLAEELNTMGKVKVERTKDYATYLSKLNGHLPNEGEILVIIKELDIDEEKRNYLIDKYKECTTSEQRLLLLSSLQQEINDSRPYIDNLASKMKQGFVLSGIAFIPEEKVDYDAGQIYLEFNNECLKNVFESEEEINKYNSYITSSLYKTFEMLKYQLETHPENIFTVVTTKFVNDYNRYMDDDNKLVLPKVMSLEDIEQFLNKNILELK